MNLALNAFIVLFGLLNNFQGTYSFFAPVFLLPKINAISKEQTGQCSYNKNGTYSIEKRCGPLSIYAYPDSPNQVTYIGFKDVCINCILNSLKVYNSKNILIYDYCQATGLNIANTYVTSRDFLNIQTCGLISPSFKFDFFFWNDAEEIITTTPTLPSISTYSNDQTGQCSYNRNGTYSIPKRFGTWSLYAYPDSPNQVTYIRFKDVCINCILNSLKVYNSKAILIYDYCEATRLNKENTYVTSRDYLIIGTCGLISPSFKFDFFFWNDAEEIITTTPTLPPIITISKDHTGHSHYNKNGTYSIHERFGPLTLYAYPDSPNKFTYIRFKDVSIDCNLNSLKVYNSKNIMIYDYCEATRTNKANTYVTSRDYLIIKAFGSKKLSFKFDLFFMHCAKAIKTTPTTTTSIYPPETTTTISTYTEEHFTLEPFTIEYDRDY